MSLSDCIVLKLPNGSQAENLNMYISMDLSSSIIIVAPCHHVLDSGLEANVGVPLAHILVKTAQVLGTRAVIFF